jgi:hypothetical protein
MKRFVVVLALLALVSLPASAGEIPTGGIAPPPPPDGIQATNQTAPGEIPTSGSSYEIADTALDLIQMLIGVGI